MKKNGYILLELIVSISFLFIILINTISIINVINNKIRNTYQYYIMQNKIDTISSILGKDLYEYNVVYEKEEDNKYNLTLTRGSESYTKILTLNDDNIVYGGKIYKKNDYTKFNKIQINEMTDMDNGVIITITYNTDKTLKLYGLNGKENNI